MSKPFDATLKHLLEDYAGDWIRFLGLPGTEQVEVVDADLATITSEADKVFRIGGLHPWILHVEVQSSYDATLAARILRYNVLLNGRHGLPVKSVLVLLRREADGPELTKTLMWQLPHEKLPYLQFQFEILRIWELPAESLLNAGLGILPLAPLGDVAFEELPELIRNMNDLLTQDSEPAEAATLWAAAYILFGLRYDQESTEYLFQGVRAMKESTTYQAILQEGRAEGIAEGIAEGTAKGSIEQTRKLVFQIGRKRLGEPSELKHLQIDAIVDLARLEQLVDCVLDVRTWDDVAP